jgi:hypothetical protein
MGLITERGMARLSFGSRLLKRSWTPFDFFLPKGKQKVSWEMRRDFLRKMVAQLVQRRRALGLSSLDVDDIIGCADHLTAKWECGLRAPTSFNLMCWAESLGCQWVLVPLNDKLNPEKKNHQ